MHWLTMKLAEEISAQHLYATFKRLLARNPQPVTETIAEFAADRDVYADFFRHKPGSVPQRFFERLDALDISTVYPIALLLFRSELAREKRDAALLMLESWLVRRMICRLTASGYNRLFLDLVRALKETPTLTDQVVYDFLSSTEAESARWPDDGEVRSVLNDAPLYRVLVRKRLVMLLRAIEYDLRSEKVEPVPVPSGLSVEHLLPQSWQKHWPVSSSDPDAPGQRDSRVHRLGNLTLVTAKLNPSLSHAAWDVKRRELNKHSVLLMNSTLTGLSGWGEEAIDARTRELASRVLDIWRGPHVTLDEWRGAAIAHATQRASAS